jgi:cell division control protein 24
LTTKFEAVEETAAPAGTQMSYRDHVVRELVDTERKYVQDLENLHELKKVIEQKGVITGDVVHDIFLNINAILDFQRRFLIRIETTNSQPESRQEWGLIFVNYEDAFGIYQPFIANQRKAATIAKREFDKISLAEHPVVVDFNTLDGFLLKPMQRLIKYPQLLKVRITSLLAGYIFETNFQSLYVTKHLPTNRPKPIFRPVLQPRSVFLNMLMLQWIGS